MLRRFGSLLWERKAWWITPIVVLAALFVYLVLSAEGSGDSPFVYTIF